MGLSAARRTMKGAAGRSVHYPSAFADSTTNPFAIDRSLVQFNTPSSSLLSSSPSSSSSSSAAGRSSFKTSAASWDGPVFTPAASRSRRSRQPRLSATHQNRAGSTRQSSAGHLEIHQRLQHLGGTLSAVRERYTDDLRLMQKHYDIAMMEMQTQWSLRTNFWTHSVTR